MTEDVKLLGDRVIAPALFRVFSVHTSLEDQLCKGFV